MRGARALTAGLALCVAACAGAKSFFVPENVTDDDRARTALGSCSGIDDSSIAIALTPQGIDQINAAYTYSVGGPNGRNAHLVGAELRVRPAPGLTREVLARGLTCHEAHAWASDGGAPASDPYVLAGHWLEVDVKAERDAFTVTVAARDAETGQIVLDHARAFVGR